MKVMKRSIVCWTPSIFPPSEEILASVSERHRVTEGRLLSAFSFFLGSAAGIIVPFILVASYI